MVKQGPELLKQVRHRLIDLDMTQVQLAEKLGISPPYLCDIILGNRDRHGKNYIPKIASILGLDNPPEKQVKP